MKWVEYLSDVCIKTGAVADSKEAALHLIARLAKKHPALKELKEDEIFQGFIKREALGSTGFGRGVAIPHFASDSVNDFVTGIITFPDGVEFAALDGQPVRLIAFIIAPESKRNLHLGILSNIARFLRDPRHVDELMKFSSPKDLHNFISGQQKEPGDIPVSFEYSVITAAIQAEERFQEILDIFCEVGEGNISVIEANSANKYLFHMPLFASFWSGERKDFHRIITGVVRKTTTNQILQKLNDIIERENKKSGILVTVHDLIYKNGNLEI